MDDAVGGHPGARPAPAVGRPLRRDHLPPARRRRAAAVHLRHDRRPRRHHRRHRRVPRRAGPARRHPLVGPEVLGRRPALDHRGRRRLLALRPDRRRHPLPHPLRLPAAVGPGGRGPRPVGVPARVRLGDGVELRPPAPLAGGRRRRPSGRATRPSPTPPPSPGWPASGSTRASSRSSGRSTPARSPSGGGSGSARSAAPVAVRAVGVVEVALGAGDHRRPAPERWPVRRPPRRRCRCSPSARRRPTGRR